MKLAGIVVTYNRKELLKNNIESIIIQSKKFDKFYIVDNCSTDGTIDFLNDNGYLDIDYIEILKLEKNYGGAGGFYYGIKKAYEDGFDFIFLMDDDGKAVDESTVKNLYDYANFIYNKNKLIMINSLVLNENDESELSFELSGFSKVKDVIDNSDGHIFENYINPFNGTLISKELISAIGFPNIDFFIRGDEVDYQARAQKSNAYIATVITSRYYHPRSELVEFKWRGRKVLFGTCPPWKSYYLLRNYVYRIKRDKGLWPCIKEFIFQFYGTKKANKKFRKYVRLLFKGFFDGLRGKLGPRVLPNKSK